MLVVFEGPIAAGKTTLAGLYATHKRAMLVLEQFSENSFLGDFYADKARWSLPMQLWFLLDRHEQLAALHSDGKDLIVADYGFIKNEVFAKYLLVGREFELFVRTADSLGTNLMEPIVIVYLDASDSVLLKRIAGRGRAYETHINEAYLDGLRSTYEEVVVVPYAPKVLRFDTSHLDLGSERQLNEIFCAIDDSITAHSLST